MTESTDDAIDAQRSEYVFGREDGTLVCDAGSLVHVRSDDAGSDRLELSTDEVTDVRTQVDASVTGFRAIGVAIGLVALLFTGVAVEMFAGGAEINVITGGTALTAGFAWLAAVQYYRADRQALTVLSIDTGDERYTFYTADDGDDLDRIAERVRESQSGEAPTPVR